MTTRIAPMAIDDLPPTTREALEYAQDLMGFAPNDVLTMAHWPELLEAMERLVQVIYKPGELDPVLKRMIATITSGAAGCRYCQAHAIRAAERYGAEQEQLDHIWEYRTHPAFSEAERAALDFSLQASTVPNTVDPAIKARLYRYWNEGEIVEMLGVISLFGYLNRWNDSMGTSIESGAVESAGQYLGKHGWEKGKHDGSLY